MSSSPERQGLRRRRELVDHAAHPATVALLEEERSGRIRWTGGEAAFGDSEGAIARTEFSVPMGFLPYGCSP